MKRYEIRWVSLDPVAGAEIAKTRPAVLVSRDELNAALRTVTVCPITSQLHPAWRSRLGIRVGGHPAEAAADQIRTVSKERLGRKLGALTEADAEALRRILTQLYGE